MTFCRNCGDTRIEPTRFRRVKKGEGTYNPEFEGVVAMACQECKDMPYLDHMIQAYKSRYEKFGKKEADYFLNIIARHDEQKKTSILLGANVEETKKEYKQVRLL